jgi:hypothetical protein
MDKVDHNICIIIKEIYTPISPKTEKDFRFISWYYSLLDVICG